MTCACGRHELEPRSYIVAEGCEHRAGFCHEQVLPDWWPPRGKANPRKPCRCGRKETTERRPTKAQQASGLAYHTQEECFALDANGATCLWRDPTRW